MSILITITSTWRLIKDHDAQPLRSIHREMTGWNAVSLRGWSLEHRAWSLQPGAACR